MLAEISKEKPAAATPSADIALHCVEPGAFHASARPSKRPVDRQTSAGSCVGAHKESDVRRWRRKIKQALPSQFPNRCRSLPWRQRRQESREWHVISARRSADLQEALHQPRGIHRER